MLLELCQAGAAITARGKPVRVQSITLWVKNFLLTCFKAVQKEKAIFSSVYVHQLKIKNHNGKCYQSAIF